MDTAILILSGGQSRRMGIDKASLKFAGETLLSWQIARFENAGFNVVSGLKDLRSGSFGPLAGIEAGLFVPEQPQAWIVVPVDMPLLSQDTIQLLIEQSKSLAVPVCFQGYPLPVVLPNTVELKSLLHLWLGDENGPRSIRKLFTELKGQFLTLADTSCAEMININTPEQWRDFKVGESSE